MNSKTNFRNNKSFILLHPSQLYEAFKNLVIFSATFYLYKFKELPKGFIFWTFLFMYGCLRFVAEFFRDWPTSLFGLTHMQLLSIPLAILSGYMLLKLKNNINVSEQKSLQTKRRSNQ